MIAAPAVLLAQLMMPIGPPPAPVPQPAYVVPTVHALVLMTGMRVGESILYPDPFARVHQYGAHYVETFSKPPIFDSARPAFEWDGDPWTINTFGHGLFGSELYLRARMCRLPWYGALVFAAAGSTLWEYGFEGSGVRPSALDLVWTPLAGMVLGEGRYFVWHASRGIRSASLRQVARAAVDPFGELERAFGAGC